MKMPRDREGYRKTTHDDFAIHDSPQASLDMDKDEYYDYPYDFDDPFDDYNDPNDSHEYPDDTDEDNEYLEDHNVERDDDDNGREDSCNDDYLYRCKARFKGHIECLEIFSCEYDISEHLSRTHKTQKWLVDIFVRIM